MNKGILTALCLMLVVLMPACHRNGNEGSMKKEKKQTRTKTEKKTYSRKNKNGNVVEETTTTKTESVQRPQAGKTGK